MVAKIAIVFVGLIMAMMFAKIYAIVLFSVMGLLFDLGSPLAFIVQYLACLVAGAFNAFYLMRGVWPTNAATRSVQDAQRS